MNLEINELKLKSRFWYKWDLFPTITATKDSAVKIRSFMGMLVSKSNQIFTFFNLDELDPMCYVTVAGDTAKMVYIEGFNVKILDEIKKRVLENHDKMSFTCTYYNSKGELIGVQNISIHGDHKPEIEVLFNYYNLNKFSYGIGAEPLSPETMGELPKIINAVVPALLKGNLGVLIGGNIYQIDKSLVPYIMAYNFTEYQISRLSTIKVSNDYAVECSYWLSLLYRNEELFNILHEINYEMPTLGHIDILKTAFKEARAK